MKICQIKWAEDKLALEKRNLFNIRELKKIRKYLMDASPHLEKLLELDREIKQLFPDQTVSLIQDISQSPDIKMDESEKLGSRNLYSYPRCVHY